MNRPLAFALLTFMTIFGLGAIAYSVGTHQATSTGTIEITAPPETGEITVASTINFGTIQQGLTTEPIQVHVDNTVQRTLTLTIEGGIQGAITVHICNDDGDTQQSVDIPTGGANIYLKATTTSNCPTTTGEFPITFTAS